MRPYQRGSSSGSGKYHATVNPGLRLIVPFVDRIILVDMREQVVDVPPQEVITSDNVVVSVDAVVYYEATDPQRLALQRRELRARRHASSRRRTCATSSATCSSTRRSTSARHDQHAPARDPRRRHRQVGRARRARRDPAHRPAARRRGSRCTTRCRPSARGAPSSPRRSASARPAITRAEGEKQAAILEAEARSADPQAQARRAIERLADAERYRQIAVAEGEAQRDPPRLRGHPRRRPDDRRARARSTSRRCAPIADGQATKIFLPTEMSGLFGAVGGLAELLRTDSSRGNGSGEPAAMAPAVDEGGAPA